MEENQERLLKLLEQAEKEGYLRLGGNALGITLSKRKEMFGKPPSQKIMLRILTEAVDLARHQAAGTGISYRTYVKMLWREGRRP